MLVSLLAGLTASLQVEILAIRHQLVLWFVGSIRRECLDHVVVLSEESLCRILRLWVSLLHGENRSLQPLCFQPAKQARFVYVLFAELRQGMPRRPMRS